MASKIHVIAYPVQDLEKAKKFYSTYLDTEPYADSEWYVGYRLGDLEIGLDPHGKAIVSYANTSDIAASLKTLEEAGATIVMEPKDVGGGMLIAQVEIQGNVMGLRQEAK
jgi:predicted enzyme related to lactoylglutathione lyase